MEHTDREKREKVMGSKTVTLSQDFIIMVIALRLVLYCVFSGVYINVSAQNN